MNPSSMFARATRHTAALPARVAPTASPAPVPADARADHTNEPASILLMTPNLSLRHRWIDWCTGAGYIVWHTALASEGLRAVADVDIDLAVVDATLPNIGGRGMAEYIRAMHPHTRVILTAFDAVSDDDDMRMAALGAPVVTQPDNRAILVATIRDELRLVDGAAR